MELSQMKNVELDKICRICLTVKKDMRPLFGEMVAEMVQEISGFKVLYESGWPDKLCIQCVHQVSRCHAFKKRIEKSDKELRQYIKGLTVIVEEVPRPQEMKQQRPEPQQQQQQQQQPISSIQAPQQIQEIQIQRAEPTTLTHHHPQQMLLANILNNNNTAQLINGQIVTTANGQQLIQTSNGQLAQIGQFIQGPNNTIQVLAQNGAQAQILHIQRTSDGELIMQPTELSETQFFEDVPVVMTANGQNIQIHNPHQTLQPQFVPVMQTQQHIGQQHIEIHQQQQQHQEIDQEEQEDDMMDQGIQEIEEEEVQCHEQIEEEEIEETEPEQEQQFIVTHLEESETEIEDKQLMADFLAQQTRCEGPGRHICNLCSKEFKHVKWLHSHMKSHSNWIRANCKKLPQCEICHKSFRGPGMLKMHLKSHEKENKLPTCTICGKEFKSKSILYRHRQTHFEAKTHKCTICDKEFNSNYQLSAHTARHKGERSHHCPHCEKSYYNTSDLKTHIQQHLGVRVKKQSQKSN